MAPTEKNRKKLTPEEKTGMMIIGIFLLVVCFVIIAFYVIGCVVHALNDPAAHRPSEWQQRRR